MSCTAPPPTQQNNNNDNVGHHANNNNDDMLTSSTSVFSGIQAGPPIEVFALTQAYNADTFDRKVNLGVGAYRTETGTPWVLPLVRRLESAMATDTTLNKEYLPVLGLPAFTKAATAMLLGSDAEAIKQGRAIGVQTLSGTGGLRVAAELLSRVMGKKHVLCSQPTWENHRLVFLNGGFQSYGSYRYWDDRSKSLDIQGMLEDLRNSPRGTVVILHACAHNPTGMDPDREQWGKIAGVMREMDHFPLFDSAYQGFASGDLDADAWAVRHFLNLGFEMFVTQSFAKNFGLYNERVGNLTIVSKSSQTLAPLLSQLTLIIRGMYSNPPSHGARLVAMALNDPDSFQEWRECVQTMSGRVRKMRLLLREKLEAKGAPSGTANGTWDHVTRQIGMFSYTGLSPEQVDYLRSTHHIYMLRSGRVNICGLNEGNLDYVANAIDDTVRKVPHSNNN